MHTKTILIHIESFINVCQKYDESADEDLLHLYDKWLKVCLLVHGSTFTAKAFFEHGLISANLSKILNVDILIESFMFVA